MSKTASFAALAAVLVLGIATLSFGPGASVAQAQGDTAPEVPFDVFVELDGVVVAITPELLTLDEGLLIVLTPETFVAPEVAVGVKVTVIARVDDAQFVADAVYPVLARPTGSEWPYQLNLGFVGCVDDMVGVHLVLLHVPDGITPGNLDFTYGAGIPPQRRTGNVWHYWAYLPSGTYVVTEASVTVDGQVVSLHNPGAYSGDYTCVATPEPTLEPTLEPTEEPTLVPTAEPTLSPDCNAQNQHPVAMRLAEAFDVPYEEIINWHCMGIGFGEIARAYELEDLTADGDDPLTVEGLFDRRFAGEGWGNIVKESGVEPNRLAPGQVKRTDDAEERNQEMEQAQEEVRANRNQDDGPGNSENAPGQNKDDRDNGNNSNRNNDNHRGGRNR